MPRKNSHIKGGEVINKSFDPNGVPYSGFIPKAEQTYREYAGQPEQEPLTDLEFERREEAHAKKDPIAAMRIARTR